MSASETDFSASLTNLFWFGDEQRTPRLLSFFLLFFVCLGIYNHSHFFDPPYWDGTMGVYRQASWLARNDFDYARLMLLDRYPSGPKISITYLYAPFYALLLKLFSVPIALCIMHTLTISLAALAGAIGIKILARYLTRSLAVLWTVSVLFQPLWSGQIAGIYMEVPVALSIIVALELVRQRRWGLVTSTVFIGFLVKQSLFLFSLALLTFFVFRILVYKFLCKKTWSEFFERRQIYTCLPFFVFFFLLNSPKSKLVFAFIARLKLYFNYIPDLMLLLALFTVLTTIVLLNPRTRQSFLSKIEEFDDLSLWSIFIFGFLLSYLIHHIPVPRYWVGVAFPLAAGVAVLSQRLLGNKASYGLCILWLSFSLLNQNGQFLGKVPIAESRSGGWLERSREYLTDLQQQREFFRAVEEKYSDSEIVVRLPNADILTRPELGYVRKPLENIIQVSPVVKLPNYRVLTVKQWLSKSIHVIWVANSFENSYAKSGSRLVKHQGLAPRKQDKILIKIEHPEWAPLILYERKN